MHAVDWLILFVPVLAVVYIGWRVQRYTKGVASYLTGGRLAGRYVVAVAGGEAVMGMITVIALFEKYYQSGYAIGFWATLSMPVGLILTLTGFIIFRYRETRVMTIAQFFEVRYSRNFRIFAGLLSYVAGVVNYAIFPAIGARFFIFYSGLPDHFEVLGWTISMFPLIMAVFLGVALMITLIGGQLTIMVADCVQGIMSYAGYALVFVAIMWIFSFTEFKEAMLNRPPAQSFMNPFDTGDLKEFNLLFILIGLIATVYNRMSWQGLQGYNAAALNAHEQKMAGVLGTWKNGFQTLMIMLLAFAAYTYMHHPDFAEGAAAVQQELVERIHGDSAANTATLQNQMTVPVAVRAFLPIGIIGVFLACMIFWNVSTDTSYLHSWGSIFIQDVVLPLRGRPFKEKTHLLLLRLSISGVAVFAYFFSLLYSQTTHILMFFALTGALYLGGSGAVLIGGMYWSRGTTAGAWAAMIMGLVFALVGFVCTQFWGDDIYPFLAANHPGVLEGMSHFFARLSAALPIASWEVGPKKFPISGQEILLLTMIVASTGYVVFSLLTCREKFNLDRMLHRGQYTRADDNVHTLTVEQEKKRGILQKILGFNEAYTRGDRIMAWSVFGWTMFQFSIFAVVAAWNIIFGVWSEETWFLYWKYKVIAISAIVAVVSTVWFTIGGTVDLRRLFQRLKSMQVNTADDGTVIGHMNADDYLAAQARAAASAGIEQAVPGASEPKNGPSVREGK